MASHASTMNCEDAQNLSETVTTIDHDRTIGSVGTGREQLSGGHARVPSECPTSLVTQRQEMPLIWTTRFEKVSVPFELRLLNGMNPPVPEVTVLIHKVTKDRRAGEYQLHIKKVLGFKHWDKRRQKPKR